VRQEK